MKTYLKLIDCYKIKTTKKKIYFDVQITKKTLHFIKVMQQLGLIQNYLLLSGMKCRIFPFYTKNFKKTRTLQTYLGKSQSLKFSNNSLKTLHLIAPTSSFLLETNQGLVFHREAIQRKVGGKLLIVVH